MTSVADTNTVMGRTRAGLSGALIAHLARTPRAQQRLAQIEIADLVVVADPPRLEPPRPPEHAMLTDLDAAEIVRSSGAG